MNLFEPQSLRSELNPFAASVKPQTPTQGVSGGGMMPPSVSAIPAEETFDVNALDQQKISAFIARAKELGKSKEEAMSAFDAARKAGAFNKAVEEKGTLAGFGEKTKEAFVSGVKGVAQAGKDIAKGVVTGEDIGRPLLTGVVKAGEAVLSPVIGAVGQTFEEVAPDVVKEKLGEGVESFTSWKKSLDPNASKLVDDLILSAEFAGTILGAPKAIRGAGKSVAKAGDVAFDVTKKAGETVAEGVGKISKNVSKKLPKAEELLVKQLEKTNRMNPTKYVEFEKMAGQRAGKFLADRGIVGDSESNVAKLYSNFEKSKSEADKGLSAIKKTYKVSDVPESYKDMLSELEKRFSYTKDKSNLNKINEYKTKLDNGTLSHNDINATKRLYEQKVKVNYIKDQNSLEVDRATNIDNDLRNWQFDEAEKLGFSNLKDINKETQLSRFLADNIGDKIAKQAGLNNISLTDWIIAGQIPGTPEALALFAGKKLAQNIVPKVYQKLLEKTARLQKKKIPVADIENINKIESIRKALIPNYDTNRLLSAPRSSSRSPRLLTPDVIKIKPSK